ncbi:hypothetical protein EMCRGX_G006027 [Ephydatia muelleri]
MLMSTPESALHTITLRTCRVIQQLFLQNEPCHTHDAIILQCELLYRCLIAAGAHTVADLVAEGLVMLAAADSDAENATIHVAVMRTGDRGRPKILLNTSQLADMLQLHFKVPHIARLFGVSVRTIRRRMKDAGLYVSDLYCTLSDAQLDEVVRNVFQQFPNSGYCMMAGHLRHLNIHVQQLRIRDSLHRI